MRRPSAPVLLVLAALSLTSCTAVPAPPPTPRAAATPTWPVIGGRVVERTSDPQTRRVRIAVDDPEAAYAAARRLLVRAGYQLTKDRPGRGGGDGQACTTALCVQFSATVERRWGPNLLYEAFRSTGVVPLS